MGTAISLDIVAAEPGLDPAALAEDAFAWFHEVDDAIQHVQGGQ